MLRNYEIISIKKFYLLFVGLYIVALVWLIQSFIFEGYSFLSICPSKLLWHIPCPGCGTTRAMLLILKGDILSGILLNPNVIIAVFYFVVGPIFVIMELITRRRLLYQVWCLGNNWLSVKYNLLLVLLFEGVIWARNIFMGI